MSEVVEVNSLSELQRIVGKGVLTVKKYGSGIDERNGWDTHLVSLDGEAMGFTDGTVPGL